MTILMFSGDEAWGGVTAWLFPILGGNGPFSPDKRSQYFRANTVASTISIIIFYQRKSITR